MSTLRTNTLQDASGGNSVPMATVAAGTAKAWVNFNGTFGSSPFTIANGGIRAAFNVSSITDNGTGDYTVNFTTAMVDANYALASGMFDTNGTGNVYMTPQTYSTKQTTSVRVFSSTLLGSNNIVARIDQANMDVAIFR